jgi:hypothetical protein
VEIEAYVRLRLPDEAQDILCNLKLTNVLIVLLFPVRILVASYITDAKELLFRGCEASKISDWVSKVQSRVPLFS